MNLIPTTGRLFNLELPSYNNETITGRRWENLPEIRRGLVKEPVWVYFFTVALQEV